MATGIDTLLMERKLIFVTGKGGIGKTLVTCMLAKKAWALGRRVLVVEQSSVEQIGSLLDFSEIGHEEQWAGSLGVANFTLAGNFKDYISNQLMKSHLLDLVLSNKIVHSLFTAIPGFGELMLLGRVFYAMNLSKNIRPDLIIMDSFASGHFMSLMTTPDAVLQSGLAGPIVQHTLAVKKWLGDSSQCATLYVATPEELVISEALEFLPILAEKSPVKLAGVIMNRCLSELENCNDAPSIGSKENSTPSSEPRNVASEFMRARRVRQKVALEKYTQGVDQFGVLKNLPVWHLAEMGAVSEPLENKIVELYLGVQHDEQK